LGRLNSDVDRGLRDLSGRCPNLPRILAAKGRQRERDRPTRFFSTDKLGELNLGKALQLSIS